MVKIELPPERVRLHLTSVTCVTCRRRWTGPFMRLRNRLHRCAPCDCVTYDRPGDQTVIRRCARHQAAS